MEVRRAYCSAVDRNVPVILTKAAPAEDRLTVSHPAALSCLDYPTRCTGWCCPLHAADEARAAVEADPGRPGRPGPPPRRS
ncbi:MAG: hypothetical protein GWM90_09240 [Gemmatimonadetes bacterium]|nr:hypothetical protein [Gemmatimonadota bacterium]NIQ54082.1 hypothetical protein [Gemmatimonadota bacterium]NIU74275.1 hypothetical protein [Gammaproteobacteria bacterium]NIX44292.1 hypothetical protein [Gemmatimonadota bacterium]NIY08509.1 hypothetical protein [Gemmatimonadota bacterium]